MKSAIQRHISPVLLFFVVSALLLTVVLLLAPELTLAQSSKVFDAYDTGTLLEDEGTLGNESPAELVLGLVSILVNALAVIFFGLALYAGIRWMTAGGKSEYVEKAQNTLRNAIIGMAVTLSSFGLYQFVVDTVATTTGTDVINAQQLDADDALLGGNDPIQIVSGIISFALGLGVVVALAFILYAGMNWMFSAGNPDKIKTSRDTLIRAAIGMVLLMGAWGITLYVIDVVQRASNQTYDSRRSSEEAYEDLRQTPQGAVIDEWITDFEDAVDDIE